MKRTETQIGNQLEDLVRVVRMVDRFGAAHAIPASVVNDLNLALDEVLNNIVSYGYKDQPREGPAAIAIRLSHEPGYLRAEVEDDGIAFNPLLPRSARLDTASDKRALGGRGIRFIRGLMDEVAYERIADRNRLRLTKRIPPVN